MTYSEEIKKIRQKCFLSQEAFGRELGVSFSSINRWESGKTKPNMSAMKKIKEFCEAQGIDFCTLEAEWTYKYEGRLKRMAIKHKVTINVTDENGNNVKILRGGQLTLPQKIIKFLFGDYRQVFLLDPGQSVQSVDVKEIKEGGSTDGKDE